MPGDLILRRSTLLPSKPWALQLRWHDSLAETEYLTLARVTDDVAREIMKAGAPTWLHGDPDNALGNGEPANAE